MINFSIRDTLQNDRSFCRNLQKNMEELIKKNRKKTSQQIDEDFNEDYKKGGCKIVEHNWTPIGFFQLLDRDNGVYINELHICPDFRNLGIGSHLLKLIEQETIKRHLSKIRLEVFLDNRARMLYDKFGYKTIKHTKDNSVIMEKRLKTEVK